MEENDAFFTNQSISPSHDITNNLHNHDNIYTNNSTAPTIKKERLDTTYTRQPQDNSYEQKTPSATYYDKTNNSINGRRISPNDEQWRTASTTAISLAN
jgi:hypothetical protein